MLYPVGFKPEDFSKPMIGIASTWGMVTPCNMHIDQLAREAETGANDAGAERSKAVRRTVLRVLETKFIGIGQLALASQIKIGTREPA